MKIKFSPQVHLKSDIEYVYGEEQILAKVYKVTLDENNEEVDREIENTFYIDFSKIEYGKIYPVDMPLAHASRDENGELYIEVINYIGYKATEEENFPKEFTPLIEDFEIPEDAKIIQLEELIIPELEPDPVETLARENEELKRQLQLLQTQTDFNKKDSDMMMMELIGMINSVI